MSQPAKGPSADQDRSQTGVSRIAYTIDEAAHALGVSRRIIEGMINRRELKPRQVGRRLLIGADALKRLFQ